MIMLMMMSTAAITAPGNAWHQLLIGTDGKAGGGKGARRKEVGVGGGGCRCRRRRKCGVLHVQGDLSSQRGVPRAPLLLDGVLVHALANAALQPTRPTLISVRLVHQTLVGAGAASLAHVLPVAAN